EASIAGILPDFHLKMAQASRIQFAGVVVRKATYEQVGGFRADLRYVLDWEMWLRICLASRVWYEPTVLASYRLHSASATAGLQRTGADVDDIRRFLKLAEGYFSDGQGRPLMSLARRTYALRAVAMANRFLKSGKTHAALSQLRAAWRLNPSPVLLRGTVEFGLRILK